MSEARAEEIVIVGGGLAGASAACLLADAGRDALLIEREAAPRDKICGEFLSIEAQTYLARLGLDLDALGASRISRLRLVQGRDLTEAELPFSARGLSRRVLDESLLQQARSRGARILRGMPVRSILADGASLRVDGGFGTIRAETVFLATGKHDVRNVKREAGGTMDDLIGFKMHYRLAKAQRHALEDRVEIVLFAGGYAGLQLVEDGTANLCLVATRQCFEQAGRSWSGLIGHIACECPLLGERLQGALALFERPLSVFRIPYGFLHAPEDDGTQGLFRLGDQAGVIPSFTGDGMSIALHSGCLAASTYLSQGRASSAFHRRILADIRGPIRLASALNVAVRHSAGRMAIFHLCRAWPAAMRHVASLTRVQDASLSGALPLR